MIHPFKESSPKIDDSAFVVESAQIIGDVVIGEESSVWFNAVIRGDVNHIRIGNYTNIQDGCVLHVARKTHPLIVGDEVTVGHNVTLHACTIGSRCLIGMGAIVMDGVEIVKRELTEDEKRGIRESAANYVGDIENYLE
jgi:carbonic anhydrase/acetyltransferase-like protein (isoleucine patch superfamily)